MTNAQQEVIKAAEAIREIRYEHTEDFGSYEIDVHVLDMLDVALAERDAENAPRKAETDSHA